MSSLLGRLSRATGQLVRSFATAAPKAAKEAKPKKEAGPKRPRTAYVMFLVVRYRWGGGCPARSPSCISFF